MATNTLGTVARQYASQQVHYLRLDFTFLSANGPTTALALDQVHVGWLPAGATIIKAASGVNVDVVFNCGTNNLLDVGTAATRNLFASGLSLASIAFVPLSAAAAMSVAVDTEVQCKLNTTGTSASTGTAQVIIAYTLKDQAIS